MIFNGKLFRNFCKFLRKRNFLCVQNSSKITIASKDIVSRTVNFLYLVLVTLSKFWAFILYLYYIITICTIYFFSNIFLPNSLWALFTAHSVTCFKRDCLGKNLLRAWHKSLRRIVVINNRLFRVCISILNFSYYFIQFLIMPYTLPSIVL